MEKIINIKVLPLGGVPMSESDERRTDGPDPTLVGLVAILIGPESTGELGGIPSSGRGKLEPTLGLREGGLEGREPRRVEARAGPE